MFVDKVQVSLKAGDGGNGAVSFRQEKFVDRGGPDGGDGGKGGDIILVASRNQNTLAAFRYKKLHQAFSGEPGGKRRRHGKNGLDLEIAVPVGTVASTTDGELLADMVDDGQKIVVLKGGIGGFGNAHFVSSTRQAPRVAEKGEAGQSAEVVLELKMLADVGLVGLPNAGKSTLLSVVSNAKPEIADYPFTTLHPNLGVVDIDNKDSLLFADIPGLIEGASQGKGLGDEFLRHLERTSVLIHLIDSYSGDIVKDYKTIMRELAAYRVDLSGRPQIVVLTKTEGVDKKRLDQQLKQLQKITPRGTQVLAISSASGYGVKELLREVQKMVSATRKKTAKKAQSELPVIGLREDENFWQVQKHNDKFVVSGKKIERFAARTDFDDFHGEARLRDIMRKMGIMRELHRQGIEAGQKIYIGDPTIGSIEY
jgi:GTP-binding protein